MLTVPEYDMHVHTVLCGHAHESATVERISAHASVLKMKLICFAEHVHDAETLSGLRQLEENIRRVRHLYSCRLVMGAEIDADPDKGDGSLVVEVPDWIEFVIGSIHFLPQGLENSPEKLFSSWRAMLMGLAANPSVDMLGHPGALVFNLPELEGFRPRIMDAFRQAAKISAVRRQAWDFNNLTMDKLSGEARKDYWKVLQIAVDENVPLLYGSDTHHVASLGKVSHVMRMLSKMEGIDSERLLRLPEDLARRFSC